MLLTNRFGVDRRRRRRAASTRHCADAGSASTFFVMNTRPVDGRRPGGRRVGRGPLDRGDRCRRPGRPRTASVSRFGPSSAQSPHCDRRSRRSMRCRCCCASAMRHRAEAVGLRPVRRPPGAGEHRAADHRVADDRRVELRAGVPEDRVGDPRSSRRCCRRRSSPPAMASKNVWKRKFGSATSKPDWPPSPIIVFSHLHRVARRSPRCRCPACRPGGACWLCGLTDRLMNCSVLTGRRSCPSSLRRDRARASAGSGPAAPGSVRPRSRIVAPRRAVDEARRSSA